MCWVRILDSSAGGLKSAARVLLVTLLAVSLAGLAAPPGAQAVDPNPVIQLTLNEGGGMVEGWGWNSGTVEVRLDATLLGSVATSGHFTYALTSRPHLGQRVTVRDATTPVERSVDVIALATTHVNVPGSQLSGTKGRSSLGWGALRVNTGNMYGGGTDEVVLAADDSTGWSVTLDPTYFDMMRGVGTSLWQLDADGDTLQVMQSVPNPTVRISAEGVMGNGWLPGTTVTVFLDDDPTAGPVYPYSYERVVNTDAYFWGGPPDDPQWQVIQPGWMAKVVGPYESRDGGTVTKEVQFADLPVPTVTDNVISGVIPGPLSDTTVGQGSLVNAAATCPGLGTNAVNRSALASTTDGSYTVDFGTSATQPWGWGGPCVDPLYYYGANAKDRDGDEVHFNWFVDGMFDDTHPSLMADEPITDGTEFGVVGTGWDMTALRIQQCAMDGELVGDCDPTTTQYVTSYPDDTVPGIPWPQSMARFDASVYAKQVLELSGGAVDCAEAPGTCAVVVTEPYRPGISAFDTLTYDVPYWVELGVTVAPTGTVSSVSGTATIRGTVTASDTVWVHLTGELRQRLGRRVVAGWVDTWRFVDEPGVPIAWEVQVMSYNGYAFGSGSAEMMAWVDLGDEGSTDGASSGPVVVKLTMVRPPKPPRR